MILTSLIISLTAGSGIGLLYGLLFLYLKKGARTLIQYIIFTLCRFLFLTVAAFYILRLPSIAPVILVLSFITTFWLIILMYKAFFYERRWTSNR